jgi:acetyl esterase/lipase
MISSERLEQVNKGGFGAYWQFARFYIDAQSAWRVDVGGAASPLYANLRGLLPFLIHVGEAETLYDDSARIAHRATEAGVEVVLKEWKDMPHVFQLFAPGFPETKQSVAEIWLIPAPVINPLIQKIASSRAPTDPRVHCVGSQAVSFGDKVK